MCTTVTSPSIRAELVLVYISFLALFCPVAAESQCRRDTFAVAVDIGHTKKQVGTVSARGVPEFEFNERVAKLLHTKLVASGYKKALLINENGAAEDLESRAREANAAPFNLLISIHHDSVQPKYLSTWSYHGRKRSYSDRFRGFSIFVSRKNGSKESSISFAKRLGDSLLAAQFTPTLHHAEPIPGEGRELFDTVRGIYFFDDLIILKEASVPAVLLECGVIKHRKEEVALTDAANQAKMVEAIAAAIDSFCAAGLSGVEPAQAGSKTPREAESF